MELSSELESLLSTGLQTTASKVALLRFFRLNRGAISYPALVSHQGSLLRPLGEGSVGEDYWSILEQTLTSSLYCGRVGEARACLALLQGRFVAFSKGRPSREEEPGIPQAGSLRVRFLELLVQEWESLHGSSEAGSGTAASSSSSSALASPRVQQKAVRREYSELVELRPAGGGAAARRLAVLEEAPSPRAHLVKLLDTHLGDAPSWQELAELYARGDSASAASLPQAIHCYEELVLLSPNQAGWHARLADLHAARHGRDIAGEGAVAGLRQARLHAAEAVRLSEGGVAYAAAALADTAYLYVLAVLAAAAHSSSSGGRALAAPHRVLPGGPLADMQHALSAASSSSSSSSDSPSHALPLDDLPIQPASLEAHRARTVEESLALHALACAYLESARSGPGGAVCAALEGRGAVDAALCGPGVAAGERWLALFPALAVEGALLRGKHAAAALAAQSAFLGGVAKAIQAGK
jgi:hypothetical protein